MGANINSLSMLSLRYTLLGALNYIATHHFAVVSYSSLCMQSVSDIP